MENKFEVYSRASTDADDLRRKIDFDDLQREIAGIDVGRIPRFLSLEAREAIREAKGGGDGKSRSRLSTLDLMLLSDPDYLRLYDEARDALGDAEQATERALEKALSEAETAQDALDETLDVAMKLPDGTQVFMDSKGIVRDEDGNAVDIALAATLEWRGYEPSYETYAEQRGERDEANATVQRIRGDQLELGEIREELTDENDPPSKDRVQELADRADEIKAQYEEAAPVQEHIPDQPLIAAKPDL